MTNNLHNDEFIIAVKENHRDFLEQFYNSQRNNFANWALSRFHCDTDTIMDVYQDAIVTLYFNIAENKITGFEVTPEAYLFGIARNLLLKKNIKSKRTKLVEDFRTANLDTLDYNIYDRIDADHQKQEIKNALGKLKESCKQIIVLFYYHRYSIEAIQKKMLYNNENVVKSRKNQCMKHLRQLLQKTDVI